MSSTTENDNKDRAKIKPSSTAPNPFSPIVFSFTFPVRSVPQPSPFVQIQQFCTTPYSSVCVTCAGISPTCRENARSSSDPGTAVEDKLKSKIQTVLKSTKLLHEQTMYLLIYVHACMYMYIACLVVLKGKILLKKFWCLPCVHWNQRCLENGAEFTNWMSQNLHSIFFLWIDLTYMCFVRTAFF